MCQLMITNKYRWTARHGYYLRQIISASSFS